MKETIYQLINRVRLIYNEFYLFYQDPRAYLYLFVYPKDKKVKIEAYDSEVVDAEKALIGQITKLYPDLTIHFVGSAALGIAGQKDIDLFAECLPQAFDKYLPGLITLFGQPAKRRERFVQWDVTKKGYKIELFLADPSTAIFYKPIKNFKTLRKNKKLLEEYRRIKEESNGLSVRNYEKRKLIFFNKLSRLKANIK